MEIERKFLVTKIPTDLEKYQFKQIIQGYLASNENIDVRIRMIDDEYYLTYKATSNLEKNGDTCVRVEHELPITEETFNTLISKIDGNVISKKRYYIPIHDSLTVELDIFENKLVGLVLAEVEFNNIEQAKLFVKPSWFGEDVSKQKKYKNGILRLLEKFE